MNLWCKRVSHGCGQFKLEEKKKNNKKKHIAPLTPQFEVTYEERGG